MPREKPPLTCSRCGATMNHHANKIVHPRGDEHLKVDADLEGILMESHTCPECGDGQSRPAAD